MRALSAAAEKRTSMFYVIRAFQTVCATSFQCVCCDPGFPDCDGAFQTGCVNSLPSCGL